MTGFEIICTVFILLIVALALGVIHLLYASCYIPEQRTWVGLTDEEKILMSGYDLQYAALIGVVERALKEKNT